MQAAVLPARVAYLIKQGSTTGFRRAIGEACMRWGGMTEPIARVSETGELEFRDAHAVRTAQVEAAVNVDLAPETAAVAADSLGLPCVRIADIDRFGRGIATCYPAAVTGLGGRAPSPLIAAVDSPLWQAAAAGGVQEGTSDASALHPTARVSTLDDEIGRAQLTGDTHINDTVTQFGEHRAITAGHVSVVVWVTPRDGLEDCVGFWNTRAIRPVTTVDMPMLLLPAEGVDAWQGFVTQLEALLARPAEFTPDVLLVSRALPQADLEKLAASLGLERSAEGPRAGTRFPTPPRRQPPFTFLTGADPMGMVSFERDYGLTASFDAQVFDGTTTARFSSPVHFHASGGTLVRISGAPLDRLPKRDCLAKEVHPNAEWRGPALQLSTTARRDYLFELAIPTLEKATRRLIQEATAAHAPSGPGRLAAALIRKSDIAALLKPGVYEAAVALTTPRSKELLSRLEEAAGEGEDREELVQIAATWGGRSERRSLAPDQLPGPRAQAVAAAERLSAMGWAERGLRSVCGECGVSTFVPLAEIAGAARCPGCSALSSFEVRTGQTSLFYRLDSLVDRACDHGALAHLLVITKLMESRPESCFLPGTDVSFQDGTSSEVDIFGIYGGQVLAGEVKSSGTDFTQDQLDHDIPLSARLGADVHLMAAIDTVPADARESAIRMCEEAGLELLILEGADLRPPAEQVPQTTPLQAIAALQEAAATLRELSRKPHPPKRGQLAKVVKQTLTGTESVSPTHITVLETLVSHLGGKLIPLLEGAEEQLRAVADSLSSPEPTADDPTADPPEPPRAPDDLPGDPTPAARATVPSPPAEAPGAS
jgi:hypothetical protein